jgi:hypothetical protein
MMPGGFASGSLFTRHLTRFRRSFDPVILPAPDHATGDDQNLRFDAFKAARGRCRSKVILLTLPKAGTYLLARMMENLGLVDLEVHLSETSLGDYRGLSVEQKIARARLVNRAISLHVAAGKIQPGQFAVGHIPCSDLARDALSSFARILCIRELRHALASYMRFELKRIEADPDWLPATRAWASAADNTGRLHGFLLASGKSYLASVRGIHGWASEPGVLVCRFEDLLGDHGPAIQESVAGSVASQLGMKAQTGIRALRRAAGQPTLTFSGQRTALHGLWDATAEAIFQQLGGPDLNEALGYRETEGRPPLRAGIDR